MSSQGVQGPDLVLTAQLMIEGGMTSHKHTSAVGAQIRASLLPAAEVPGFLLFPITHVMMNDAAMSPRPGFHTKRAAIKAFAMGKFNGKDFLHCL